MSVWLPPVRRSLRGDERTFGVRGNRAEVVAIFLHDAYSVDIKVNLARAQSKNLYSVLDVDQEMAVHFCHRILARAYVENYVSKALRGVRVK